MYCRVFGEGYPSLPTMTVDDWYDQHRRQGCLPDQGIPRSTGAYTRIECFCRTLIINLIILSQIIAIRSIIRNPDGPSVQFIVLKLRRDLPFYSIQYLCLSSTAHGDAEEDERAERERKEENDDEEALQKARDWDNWKDTHRRGYGNRKNMG